MIREIKLSSPEIDTMYEKLLSISISQFIKNGYYATTMETVSKEAGITKGAIYHHFASKTEMAMVALKRIDQFYLKFWEPSNYEDPDPKKNVGKFIDQAEAMIANENIELSLILVLNQSELNSAKALIPNIMKDWIESIHNLLAPAYNPHLSKCLSRTCFMLIVGALYKTTIDWQYEKNSVDLKRALKLLLLSKAPVES